MDEKHKLLGNFEKNLIKFNRKIEVLVIFGKFVAKNRAFGNNIIFLQQSFSISGEDSSACSPWLRHWVSNFAS